MICFSALQDSSHDKGQMDIKTRFPIHMEGSNRNLITQFLRLIFSFCHASSFFLIVERERNIEAKNIVWHKQVSKIRFRSKSKNNSNNSLVKNILSRCVCILKKC